MTGAVTAAAAAIAAGPTLRVGCCGSTTRRRKRGRRRKRLSVPSGFAPRQTQRQRSETVMSTNEGMQREEGTDTALWGSGLKEGGKILLLHARLIVTKRKLFIKLIFVPTRLRRSRRRIFPSCWLQFLSSMMPVTHMKAKVSQTVNRTQKADWIEVMHESDQCRGQSCLRSEPRPATKHPQGAQQLDATPEDTAYLQHFYLNTLNC